MADVTTDFFQALALGGPHPELENAGTLRFDLRDAGKRTARWLVALENGTVTVSGATPRRTASCARTAVFDRVASGEQNGMAASCAARSRSRATRPAAPLPAFFPAPPRGTR